MASERVLAFWGLVFLVVPLASSGLGGGGSRVDRFFFGICVPLTFLLLGFVPRVELAPALAVGATLAFSGVVAAIYLALVPQARRRWPGLLMVLGLVDVAALVVVHFSEVRGLGFSALAGLLMLTTASVGAGAVWLGRLIRRARHVEPR